ncbi:MAG: ornithine carbamoyltransferase [Rhodobacterales bacterium CG_4_10_14_0_8_um_filter_70_9]|nr:MAG: ornithine carbamoyltransferase [Rhodobacterales bacterium CG_4_10_14_0_8_um_filter_70_9]
MTRHFLDLAATSAADLRAMLDAARAMKAARAGLPKGTADDDRPLAGRVLAMIFEKPSTRTRVSFDMAMRQLGGETILLNGHDMQLGRGETLADTARVLSRYVDAIMIRTTAHEKLLELAAHADVPVLNALTDDSHPCQVMADVMTIEEHRGAIAGKKVAWTGDGNNMAQTLIEAAGRFGFALALATPQALDVAPRYLDWARREGADVTVTRDPAEAVAGADAVITDTWLSMGDQGAARERRHNLLRPYQVDAALMARARPDALFLHCLPAHRGEEATAAVLDGPQSVIFDEAENRLHAQKGILRWCLEAV